MFAIYAGSITGHDRIWHCIGVGTTYAAFRGSHLAHALLQEVIIASVWRSNLGSYLDLRKYCMSIQNIRQ